MCVHFSALLLLVVTAAGCWGGMSSTSVMYEAQYSDKRFTGDPTEYFSFGSGSETVPEAKIAPIYLRLKDGTVIKLAELSESTASDWFKPESEALRKFSITKYESSTGMELTSYKVDSSTRFVFYEGRLLKCIIDGMSSEGPFDGVQVGPAADGEFLSFPIKRKDLVRVFGEPELIRKIEMRRAY